VRTTLSLDVDAAQLVRGYAREHDISLGKAASELIRRGSLYRLGTHSRNGLPVFDVPEDFPAITGRQVREILDEG
jgi:hypothetical protein